MQGATIAVAKGATDMAKGGVAALAANALLAMSCAVIVAVPAAAQSSGGISAAQDGPSDTDDDSIRPGASLLGLAGFLGRGLSVSASFSTRYESNLSRRQPADDGVRYLPRIAGEYRLGSNRLGLSLDGSYGRDFVRGNNFFRGGDRTNLGAGVNFALSRCAGELGGTYRDSLNLRSDASEFGGFQQQSHTYGFSIGCRFGSSLSVNASVNKSESQNSRGGSRALNVQRLSYTAGVGFNANGIGQLTLSGSLSNIDLPGRLVVTPTGIVSDGFQQSSVRVGVARSFGSRLNVSAGASLIGNNPDVESTLVIIDGIPQVVDRNGSTGFGYDGAIDFALSTRLNVKFTTNRNINANPFVGAFLTITSGNAISIGTKLGSYDLSTGARFRRLRFQGSFASEFDPVPRRNDRMQSYFMRISGKIGQRIRATLEFNHTQRVSDPALLSFTSTGGAINLSMSLGKGKS